MKKAVVITALSGFALAGFGLTMQTNNPALGAELDGFAINTQDKAVTITLFTDQKVPYTTEHQGKQYTIVLPNTQLSETQINSGLPVVIDNKNRFIGRAVPTEDGKVKIILPNLPASDYAVSVQQQHGQQTTTVAESPAPSIKPRPAITQPASSRFESVAANFPKPVARSVANPNTTASNDSPSAPLSLKLNPSPGINPHTAGGNAIWNPYVVKTPTSSSTAYHRARPASAESFRKGAATEPPINTISIADSVKANRANTGNDPLWYLHALPPANTAALPADALAGPALQQHATEEKPAQQAIEASEAQALQPHHISTGIQNMMASIPKWLLITLALFLGGIGAFTLFGGLVLLRILFSQVRQQFLPQPMAPYFSGLPVYAAAPAQPVWEAPQPPAQAGKPSITSLVFQDTASFNALDYLKESPGNVQQAVHNTVLVKFPSRHRQRIGAKRAISRPIGNTPVYSYNP